jgi:hypothetical protein
MLQQNAHQDSIQTQGFLLVLHAHETSTSLSLAKQHALNAQLTCVQLDLVQLVEMSVSQFSAQKMPANTEDFVYPWVSLQLYIMFITKELL